MQRTKKTRQGIFLFSIERPANEDAAGTGLRIVRSWRLGERGLKWMTSRRGSPPRVRGSADRRHDRFRFWRSCSSPSVPRLRVPAGERLSERGGPEFSGRRRSHPARRNDARARRAAGHAFQRRQSDRARLCGADRLDPAKPGQGEIEWATTPPGDPNVDFVVRDEKYLDGDKAFVQALNAELARRPPGSRKVFLFIHGFNTMFAEGLYRLAQLAHDFESPGRPGAVHLGLARKAHRLCLRPQQRDRRARRLGAHAPTAARQQR